MSANAALLIIDMQVALVTGAYQEDEVLDAINHVIRKARDKKLPIFFIQHNHQSFPPLMKSEDGWQIHPSLAWKESDFNIEKEASDSFYETNLEQQLNQMDISLLLVTGMQTEFCVDATCRSALSKDFNIILVEDGHTTGQSHLPADSIIDHHNRILQNLAHPSANLTVVNSRKCLA
jgi:nicotinamidase-related amidase